MIDFTITFRGPFRVGTGVSEGMFDAPIDQAHPLPASSLKGLMRDEALSRLGLQKDAVEAVFGRVGAACPWWWSDARFDEAVQVTPTARIRVGDTGVVERGFLMIGQHVWASTAHFAIEQIGDVPSRVPSGGSRLTVDDHRLILRAAARSVSALGGGRRRGEGWVSITDADAWTADDTSALMRLKAAA